MKEQRVFYYGVQYYRPPNPPRRQHRFHLEKIKNELKFNIVKVWTLWNACHRMPDAFDFAECEEILSICDELGLNVLINTSLEDAPYWLEQSHPEARYVNAKGRPEELSGNDNHPSGGHPGLCLDNATVVRQAEGFLTAVAGFAKGHRSVIGYDCWNEPHIEPNWNTSYWARTDDLLFCYCPGSIRAFRQWLLDKYQTVEALNAAWSRFYGRWEEVNPPRRHGNFADWLDWWRFWFDNLQRQMQWRYDVIRRTDPDHFIMSHSGGIPPVLPRIEAGINNFSLAKPVDIWGTSMAPLAQNWTTAETAAAFEVTRSAARGKEYWVSEMQAGYCHNLGLNKCPRPQPRHIRSWNWLTAVYGAKAILYWCYLTESTGNEAQGFGLIRFNGETTERAREAARNCCLLQEYHHLFADHRPRSDVAILYDPDSSTILFAQEGHDRWISNSHVAYYRTVWDSDLYARWVTPEDLTTVTEKLMIVPMHYVLSRQTADALRAYVAAGGTLIAENSLGLYSPNGMLQPQVPPFGLAEVFGVEEEENDYTWPGYQSALNQPFNGPYSEDIHNAPEITLSLPELVSFRAHGFITPLRLTTAKSLGEWKNLCLAASNGYGKGRTYYFGTFVGLAMFNGEMQAARLLQTILHSTTQPQVRGRDLRPRLIAGGKEGLLCVFNNSRFNRYTEAIRIPPQYRQAVDIHRQLEIGIESDAVTVTVDPEDVVVLRLSS